MFAIRLINDGCYRSTEVYSDQSLQGLQGWLTCFSQQTRLTLDGSSRQAQEDLASWSCTRFMEVGEDEELRAFRCSCEQSGGDAQACKTPPLPAIGD